MTTRNEAAERLLNLIQAEHGPDFEPLVDDALAAERRATVERIRAAVMACPWGVTSDEGIVVSRDAVMRKLDDVILDEEAAR